MEKEKNSAEKVKHILEFTGWTGGHLGHLLGVSAKTIYSWLSGEVEPEVENAETINKLYYKFTDGFELARREYIEGAEKSLHRKNMYELDKNNKESKLFWRRKSARRRQKTEV